MKKSKKQSIFTTIISLLLIVSLIIVPADFPSRHPI